MKKKWLALSLAILLILTMAACGSASQTAENDLAAGDTAEQTEGAAAEAELADTGGTDQADGTTESKATETPTDTQSGVTAGTENLADKIIYTGYAEIETTDFDSSIAAVTRLMNQFGGFLESSTVNGNDIAGSVSQRTASYRLRIPKDQYNSLTSALGEIGNVTYQTTNADNITAQYSDTQSQLDACKIEEERLLDILSKATTVEDMITLESRLSDVRYQRESLESQLANWDNQVAYSSVTLSITEVQTLTPEPVKERTYWQTVGDGFVSSLRWLWHAGKALLRVFVAALPILVPIGIVVLVTVLLTRRSKNKKRRVENPPEDPKS